MQLDPIWGHVFKKKENEQDHIFKTLRESPLFHDLSNNDFKKIYRIIHKREYKKGEIVFKSGDPGVGMYIIKDGHVGVYVFNQETEKEDLIAELTAGQSFGDIALFCNSPRSATIKTLHQTTLLGFCKPDLIAFLSRNPIIGSKILVQLLNIAAERLEHTNQQLGNKIKELNHTKKHVEELEHQLGEKHGHKNTP